MMLIYVLLQYIVLVVTAQSSKYSCAKNTTDVVPKAYMVQLKKDAAISLSSLGKRSGNDDHAQFHKRAASKLDYSVGRQFTNPSLFYGLSIYVKTNGTDTAIQDMIRTIDNVEHVYPVTKHKLPTNPVKRPYQKTPSLTPPNAKRAAAASSLPQVTGTSNIASALKMGDVDKLHALGIKGKGIKIGIIDTGIDYLHPSLGGGFGSGFKVAGGHSYVDDNSNSVSIADPLATCVSAGHGTHVAGIIGMQDPANVGFGLVGVAPEASLYMYRVFSCDPNYQASSDDIIAAMGQALADGVNVVSMSLGSYYPWQVGDIFAQTTSGLVAAGVAVISAAGNDGSLGVFSGSAPSIDPDVISVGSADNTVFPLVYYATDTLGLSFQYAAVWPRDTTGRGRNVYILRGDGSGCDEASWIAASNAISKPAQTTIIFTNSAEDVCGYGDKEAFWTKYGFVFIMQYLVGSATSDIANQQYVVPEQVDSITVQASLSIADGAAIAANYIKAGGYGNYRFNFTNQASHSTSIPTGGFMSWYSSMGPTWDTLELKPQLSAPGGSILATWPLGFNSGYAILRGTSMATPYVSGCYALVKSQFPKLSVLQIRELLQSSAVPIKDSVNQALLATVIQQGSGMVNPYRAILASTSVSPSQLQIGDTDDYLNKKLNFTIKNKSTLSKKYTITHQGAGLIQYAPFGIHPFGAQLSLWSTHPQSATYATTKLSTTSLTISPGSSTVVFVTISPPTNFIEAQIPIISGFISIASGTNESLVIPYGGLPYSRYNARYIDTDIVPVTPTVSTMFPTLMELVSTLSGDQFSGGTDYNKFTLYDGSGIMKINKGQVFSEEDDGAFGPLFTILQPTKNFRVDLLAANTTYKPNLYGYDPTKTIPYWPVWTDHGNPRNVLADDVTRSYGLIDGGNPWAPWSGQISWFEMLVRGDVPDDDDNYVLPTSIGDYRMLLSVLRWGGDWYNLTDYQTWLSPVIRVNDTGLTCWKKPTYYCGF